MKRNRWAQGLSVSGDGAGVVSLAGSGALRLLADRVGLTASLSVALTRPGFVPGHDRGQVLVDVATVLAAGGEAIADIDTLRHEPVWGPVASPATVWRSLEAVDDDTLTRISEARAVTRRHVWAQFPGGLPASPVAATDLGSTVVIDIDATLVETHSIKEQSAANFKGGFGYHPLAAWCDNTGELLAVRLRPGNSNANHTGDHIAVLTAAIAQIPAEHRGSLLVRADTAGATVELLKWLHEQNATAAQAGGRVEYSIGFPVHKGVAVHDAIHAVPEAAWQTALDADGEVRDGAGVVEITDLLSFRRWPSGMRIIVRREKPHPGAALTLFEQVDGWRYQAIATNTPRTSHDHSGGPEQTGGIGDHLGLLDVRHRGHARVEDRIRTAKDSGLGRFPSREFAINQTWAQIAAIAADLTAWLQIIALHDAPALANAEPKLLRFRMLHVPAQLVRRARRRHLKIPRTWPWAAAIVTAFERIGALPAPT